MFKEAFAGMPRKLARNFLLLALLTVTGLVGSGGAHLLGALLIGYLAAAIYLGTLVSRTARSAGLSVGGAKREMLVGLILRLLALAVILSVAAHISVQIFAVCALGFFSAYILALGTLIHHNFR